MNIRSSIIDNGTTIVHSTLEEGCDFFEIDSLKFTPEEFIQTFSLLISKY